MNFKDLFSDFVENKHQNYDTEPFVNRFHMVHHNDFEPVSIIDPDIEKGPWIAGGAPLRWYQGQPVGDSDIDVFCSNVKQAIDLVDRIKSYGRYHIKAESDNATTIEYWKKDHYDSKWVIQVIRRRYFNNPQDIINNFDITVCQLVTNGYNIELGPRTAKDIREKNLCMTLPLAPDAVKRLTKYWTYGYRPVEGLLDEIMKNPQGCWEFNPNEDYDNAF